MRMLHTNPMFCYLCNRKQMTKKYTGRTPHTHYMNNSVYEITNRDENTHWMCRNTYSREENITTLTTTQPTSATIASVANEKERSETIEEEHPKKKPSTEDIFITADVARPCFTLSLLSTVFNTMKMILCAESVFVSVCVICSCCGAM